MSVVGTRNNRKVALCSSAVYKVSILSRSEEGYFVKYSATLLDFYKRGECPVLNPFNNLFRIQADIHSFFPWV